MKDKIIEFLDKSVTSEMILKRIALYLFLACILLVLIFFKLDEINENIVLATEPILSRYNTEKEDKVSDVLIEDKFELEDTLPLFNEIENISSPDVTIQSSTEANTNNQFNETKTEISTENLTPDNNSSHKYNFVINVNSNKIHYADCTFVNRMKEENKKQIQLNDSELNEYLNNGYTMCSSCGG